MKSEKSKTMTTTTPHPPCSALPSTTRGARPWASAALGLGLLASLGGCAMTPPAAWEKGQLAKPAMRMDGDGLEQRFTQHIYASKENASGGQSVGGGGCGCN